MTSEQLESVEALLRAMGNELFPHHTVSTVRFKTVDRDALAAVLRRLEALERERNELLTIPWPTVVDSLRMMRANHRLTAAHVEG